jgi:hypothetical protein
LDSFFGADAISFSVSNVGLPGVTRSYDSFTTAANEGEMSRIWIGFHWSFDVTAGDALGRSVGTYIFQNFLLPHGGAAAPRHAGSSLLAQSGFTTAQDLLGMGPFSGAALGRTASSLQLDAMGAGASPGQSTVYLSPGDAASHPALANAKATESSSARWEAAQPTTPPCSVDDVFSSSRPWEMQS